MEIQRPEFLPDTEISRDEMRKMQEKIGREADFDSGLNAEGVEDKVVVGIDQAFKDNKALSGAVAIKNGEVIEKKWAVAGTRMPYIPGLLAFREAPAVTKSLQKLDVEPDLLMVDGSGRIHFREAGIATHIGLIYDKPSVGIAKNLLCGTPAESLDQKLQEGRKIKICGSSDMTADEDELVGYAYQSKQYSSPKRKINPLFVSSGHKVDADSSVELVRKLKGGYKLPDPTHKADRYVDGVKSEV